MAFFVGEFETTLDPARNRLAISAAFRDQMHPEEDGANFVSILGPDRRLWLYPELYYRRLVATMRRSPLPTRQASKFNLLFGMARILKPDSQGRVVLNEKATKRAKIGKDVTLVGCGDHIEVWLTEEWDRQVDENLPDYGEMLYEAADRLNAEGSEI